MFQAMRAEQEAEYQAVNGLSEMDVSDTEDVQSETETKRKKPKMEDVKPVIASTSSPQSMMSMASGNLLQFLLLRLHIE